MKVFVKISMSLLLILYLISLTQQILFKYIPLTEIINHFTFSNHEYHWRSNNFIPFKTINFYLFLADINLNIRIENLVGNIIGFAPLGFLCPLLSKKFRNLKVVIVATFCLSLTYEVLQLLFELGSFDVDDLILNTMGGFLGYLPFKLTQLFLHFKKKIQNNNVPVS
jgi:glycopeptide antibiotics resistance protein